MENGMSVTEICLVLDVGRTTWYRWKKWAYERNPNKNYLRFRELLELEEDIRLHGYRLRMHKRLGKPVTRRNSGVKVVEVPTGKTDKNGDPIFQVVRRERSNFTTETDRDEQILQALMKIQERKEKARQEERKSDPIDPNINIKFIRPPKRDDEEPEDEFVPDEPEDPVPDE